jgi:hypothetical protein
MVCGYSTIIKHEFSIQYGQRGNMPQKQRESPLKEKRPQRGKRPPAKKLAYTKDKILLISSQHECQCLPSSL